MMKKLWLGLLVLAGVTIAPSAHAAIQVVQTSSIDCSGFCHGVTFALPTGTTAGDLLVVQEMVNNGDPDTDSSVSDTAGNTWNQIATSSNDSRQWTVLFYAANASATPSSSITLNQVFTSYTAFLTEYSGVATSSPLDKTGVFSTGFQVQPSPFSTSPTSTASQANELLIGADNQLTNPVFDSPWTIQSSTPMGHALNAIVTSTGAWALSGTQDAQFGRTSLSFASFKAAAPASTPSSGFLNLITGFLKIISGGYLKIQ